MDKMGAASFWKRAFMYATVMEERSTQLIKERHLKALARNEDLKVQWNTIRNSFWWVFAPLQGCLDLVFSLFLLFSLTLVTPFLVLMTLGLFEYFLRCFGLLIFCLATNKSIIMEQHITAQGTIFISQEIRLYINGLYNVDIDCQSNFFCKNLFHVVNFQLRSVKVFWFLMSGSKMEQFCR